MSNKYKVVVSGGRVAKGPLTLEQQEMLNVNGGVELVDARSYGEKEFIDVAKDADAILGAGKFFNRKVIETLAKCRAIVTYGVGFDQIDLQAATDNGIVVANNPASAWCDEEVANHAIALLLACSRKLVLIDSLIRKADWAGAKSHRLPMGSLYGQTIGVIGCSNIGRLTAKKASCFGLRVLGYDPYLDKSMVANWGITLVSMPYLLRESDYISLHIPYGASTHHLIGEREFESMKSNAYMINTARGGVIDEAALIRALQNKTIAGAGLDVFEKEPPDPSNPLLKMENVVLSPHIGSSSDQAVDKQPWTPAQEITRVLNGRWPKNVVNRTVVPRFNLVK